ncbi:metal ABC transporter solute-binding protein, Zn/Mn family [Pseudoneobacillus sp. C159]
MKKLKTFLVLMVILNVLLVGCSNNNNQPKDNDKLIIYTTVYPLQYFTEKLAGDFVSVHSIYPPGADEHTFEPSQRDMMNVADAQVFFYIGLGLEGFVEKAKKTLKNEGVEFFALGEQVHVEEAEVHDDDEHEDDGHHHGDIDPHIWLDPVYAKELALGIKEQLENRLPENKEQIEANYKSLEKDLDELHLAFEDVMNNRVHKEMIVSHAAFGYWEKRYGVKQISISGISSTSEPTQKQLRKIVDIARKKNIQYILFEQNVSSKLGDIIKDEIGAKPLPLHNLSTLTEENIKNKETYITLMYQNLNSIKTALSK